MTTTLRSLSIAALAGLLLASAARAEDTKPPVISDVNATHHGGKVTIDAKITDETGVLQANILWRPQGGGAFESVPLISKGRDHFAATFDGKGGTIEYYVQAIDELGNGPSKSPQTSLVLSGKSSAVASNDGAPRKRGRRKKKTEEAPAADSGSAADSGGGSGSEQAAADSGSGSDVGSGSDTGSAAAAADGPPTIEHTPPSDAKEGEDTLLTAKITGGTVSKAVAFFRKQGEARWFATIPLTKKDDENWEVTVKGPVAKGTIEYMIQATNEKGKQLQGDGGPTKPFSITFGKGGAVAAGSGSGSGEAAAGPFTFAHKTLKAIAPGVNLNLRVQATPENEADTPTKAMVLTRDASGADAEIDLAPDETGGIGGFAGQIPAPKEGALYYQVVACNKDKCAVDTGSKKSWHAVAVSNDADAKAPADIDAVSSKAPANLPE